MRVSAAKWRRAVGVGHASRVVGERDQDQEYEQARLLVEKLLSCSLYLWGREQLAVVNGESEDSSHSVASHVVSEAHGPDGDKPAPMRS